MSAPEQTRTETPAESGLKKNALGTGGITFMVISAAAPLMVIAGVAPLAIMRGGIGAPVGYLAAGMTLGIFAIGFVAMSRHIPNAGAFYTYITRGLGRCAGLASGVCAAVAYNCLQIGVYGLFAAETQATLLNLFGWNVPWPVLAVLSLLAVTMLGYRGIDVGAKVLGVLLLAETGILVVLAVAVLVQGGAQGIGFGSFAPEAMFTPGMASVLTICFAAYMGFESTVLYREEARDPRRTVPRATYISVAALAVLYAFIVWAVVQAFGDNGAVAAAEQHSETMFFAAADTYLGPWASGLMHVLIVTSVYASQLAFHNAANRYIFSLSRDGVLPGALGSLHPRHRSPHVAGMVQSGLALTCVVAFGLAGADPYLQLLLWVNLPGVLGVLSLQALVAIAVVVFFIRRGTRAPLAVGTAIVAAILLTGVVVLVIDNVDLLLVAPPVAKGIILAVMPVTFALGLVTALVLRRRDPERYRRIGHGGPDAE